MFICVWLRSVFVVYHVHLSLYSERAKNRHKLAGEDGSGCFFFLPSSRLVNRWCGNERSVHSSKINK